MKGFRIYSAGVFLLLCRSINPGALLNVSLEVRKPLPLYVCMFVFAIRVCSVAYWFSVIWV